MDRSRSLFQRVLRYAHELNGSRYRFARFGYAGCVLRVGASVFAYLFGVFVREIGHLASLALGVVEPAIVLHPFDLSETLHRTGFR